MIPSKEAFRGVIWPRPAGLDTEGKTVYQYTVIGVLVTEKPLDEPMSYIRHGKSCSEVLLDGFCPGFSEVINSMEKFRPADGWTVNLKSLNSRFATAPINTEWKPYSEVDY